MRIPVVFISDEKFIMQTCVAITSLLESRDEATWYDIHVILADADTENEKKFDWYCNHYENTTLQVMHVTAERYKDIEQLAHVSIAGLIKFEICELLSQYDKLIYLDGDTIVKKDLAELYMTNLEDSYLGAVLHSYGIVDGRKLINSGVLLFNAKRMRLDHIREKLIEKRLSLGNRKSMDQQTINILLKDKMKYIHPQYNCMPEKIQYEKKYYRLKDYNSFYDTSYRNYKNVLKDAAVIHYCGGEKPWANSWMPYGKEWYNYYLISPYGKNTLVRKNRFEFYWYIIKKEGLRGLYHWVKDEALEIVGPIGKRNRKGSGSTWE